MTEEEREELLTRINFHTSKQPTRKDYREKQLEWCHMIDRIGVSKNYYDMRKILSPVGYAVMCKCENWKGLGIEQKFYARKSSCIQALKSIYEQILKGI